MVFLIVFETALPRPLSFQWGHDIYEACPVCVRAHELRTCDGETKVTFEICQKHKDITESTALDEAVLKELRTLVHPLYSPVPTFPTVTSTITFKSREDLRKEVKVTTVTENTTVTQRTPTKKGHTTEAGRMHHIPGESASGRVRELGLPQPKITYAHGGGCIYSDEPDLVFKPRTAVVETDQHARERLRNIAALLDSGISCNLGPELDIDPDADMHALLGEDTVLDLGRYQSTSTLPPSDFTDSQPTTPAALVRRMINVAAHDEARAILSAEKERLEEYLATSSLAKALYFKRCNGQWVNAVGDVLVVDGSDKGNGHNHSSGGEEPGNSRGQDLAGDEARGCGQVKGKKEKEKEGAVVSKDGQLRGTHDTDPVLPVLPQGPLAVEVLETTSSPLAMTFTPSMTPGSSTATASVSSRSHGSPGSSSRSSGGSDSDTGDDGDIGPLKATACATTTTERDEEPGTTDPATSSGYGYGYGVPFGRQRDDTTTPNPILPSARALLSSCSSPRIHSSSSSAFAGIQTDLPHPHDTPSTPSFGYDMLQSREQLVRAGQCTDEDLCMTCWGYNRLFKGGHTA
ncbi:hypothetical protein AYO21_01544 [Fonsecaea monophora]|uniref:Uncharacterized protein n=1 Tax=Fonsecaea monophora TaxID=254056 RepID=A0A177FIS7_9EURO|nr:hypothetical protein AYO21_01544 [Fonsecaea monophora]KAH0835322.1 hypothetical protein FOPE_03871 [Fonsecaea pedrosoi]OAG44087.1 hypothetical protein AYO21_01544 [Fonsecaea monophora]